MKRWAMAILLAAAAASILPAQVSVQARRATMTGSRGGSGKCTIEVRVDGVAEVEISGDNGRLRTLTGQPASWSRMECSDPLPRNPADFRFRGIDGRGRQDLVADPRSNRGVAVVRIEDSKGGSEGYTFDIEWNGQSNGPSGGNYPGNRPYAPQQAIDSCRAEVQARAARDFGLRNIDITSAGADTNSGRRDWIAGTFESRHGGGRESYHFGCSVDFNSGRVRSVDIAPVGGSMPPANSAQGIRTCQDAVVARLNADGYRSPAFGNAMVDNRPGRGDWIVGKVTGKRGPVTDGFDFACSMDWRSGRVRSIDLNRR